MAIGYIFVTLLIIANIVFIIWVLNDGPRKTIIESIIKALIQEDKED